MRSHPADRPTRTHRVAPGRGDRTLDQGEVIRSLNLPARRLEEVGDLDLVRQRDQLALEVEQVDVRVALLLAGDLRLGDLAQQLVGAVADLRGLVDAIKKDPKRYLNVRVSIF